MSSLVGLRVRDQCVCVDIFNLFMLAATNKQSDVSLMAEKTVRWREREREK